MARQYEDHKVKGQEQRDEDDHGVIVGGPDAHEREQSGKTPAGKEEAGRGVPKDGKDSA